MPLSEKAKQNKNNYIKQYDKEHYKRIPVKVTPEKYLEIKAHADKNGESVNGYIKKAIDMRMNVD